MQLQELNVAFNERNLPCQIMIQGSVSLGISSKDSDVDAVLLVPKFVERHDFFNSFVEYLKMNKNIKDLVAVPETHVPLIKMRINDTSVSHECVLYSQYISFIFNIATYLLTHIAFI